MTETNVNNHISPSPQASESVVVAGRFPVLVYGLCGLIIVLLAGLWIMERGHRNRAQARASDIDIAITQQQKKMQSLGRLIAAQATQAKIMRNSLPKKQVKLDGKNRTVLILDAQAGKNLGLQPGDVIEVTDPLSE